MKQLAADFEAIFKRDRGLIAWMLVDFALSIWLFLESLFRLDPNSRLYWRYSDVFSSYDDSQSWWYLLSFTIMAIVLGAGHILIAARLHTKRGKDIARLFMGVSCVVIIIALHVLLSLVGRG
ncbi:hypothetical protein IJ102_01340 [Candidatus Saccharibacteria bacterium]|nr:hypothetical protein [Candidatus Saccharibacteria bacterium]